MLLRILFVVCPFFFSSSALVLGAEAIGGVAADGRGSLRAVASARGDRGIARTLAARNRADALAIGLDCNGFAYQHTMVIRLPSGGLAALAIGCGGGAAGSSSAASFTEILERDGPVAAGGSCLSSPERTSAAAFTRTGAPHARNLRFDLDHAPFAEGLEDP